MVAATIPKHDSSPLVLRLLAVHAAGVALLVLVPLLVLSLLTGSVLVASAAVVVAVAVGAGVTAWRLRGLDGRVAERFDAVPVAAGSRPRLETVVDSVAMAVGIAPPVLHVIDSDSLNSVVWGFGDGPVHLAFTSGLLERLERIELEAVVARQACIARDQSVDAVTVAASLFERFATGSLEDRVAGLVHGAVDAHAVAAFDVDGVTATRYPPAMTSALEKVAAGSTSVASIPVTFSSLCLASPVTDAGPFGLHPRIEDRVDLMREW